MRIGAIFRVVLPDERPELPRFIRVAAQALLQLLDRENHMRRTANRQRFRPALLYDLT